MPKITAAIEAKATPDIVESGGVELRARGQLLDVTDIYKKLEKEHGGWVGAALAVYAGAGRPGAPHPLRPPGFMLIARDDLLNAGRAQAAAGDLGRPARVRQEGPADPRGSTGWDIPSATRPTPTSGKTS